MLSCKMNINDQFTSKEDIGSLRWFKNPQSSVMNTTKTYKNIRKLLTVNTISCKLKLDYVKFQKCKHIVM